MSHRSAKHRADSRADKVASHHWRGYPYSGQKAKDDAHQANRYYAKANGLPLRCSALNVKDDGGNWRVHVLFRYVGDSRCTGFYMSRDTYRIIGLGVDATPDDYRAYGTLEEAPNFF